MHAAVLGAGSWGTAFATVLADAGTDTVLWARRPGLAQVITTRNENPDYLPGIRLPGALRASGDVAEVLDGADVVVLAIPSWGLRDRLVEWRPLLPRTALLVSLLKGIELGTCKRMSEVIREVADVPERQVTVVSGPTLAREIAERQPAAAVVACVDVAVAQRLQHVCRTDYFRPYTNTDVVGIELGGAVKNVIALAVGVADGMGFGDNAKASLVTRGLAETARLGESLGADPHTFSGLAGLGDLVATCSSPLSRNRTVGEKLGRGLTLDQVLATTRQTAEGIKSCRSILDLARKHDVYMPIVESVVAVVHEGVSPREMVRDLMARETKPERAR